MKKIISTTLSPNFEKDDVALSLKFIFLLGSGKGEQNKRAGKSFQGKI